MTSNVNFKVFFWFSLSIFFGSSAPRGYRCGFRIMKQPLVLFYEMPGHRPAAFLMSEVDHQVARAWAANGSSGLSTCLDLLSVIW